MWTPDEVAFYENNESLRAIMFSEGRWTDIADVGTDIASPITCSQLAQCDSCRLEYRGRTAGGG